MKQLTNKVALVTGGSRGIGAAITRRLAAEGVRVAFTYVQSAEKAEQLAGSIKANGGEALSIAADGGDPQAMIHAVQTTIDKFGRIDILVNNAGIYIGKPFTEHTLEDYERIMAVNVRAVYAAALKAATHMQAGSRIITIGSNMADNSISPQTTLYTMSKSALQGFTRGLARDLGPQHITVNLVQPGPVDTDMNPANTDLANMLRSRMAIAQYGNASDIASFVAYLASDEARYITGSVLTIDGGFNA